MAKIQKLSDQLTNMIAAGEVVERPMGVVKELVENAIDAGADEIVVRIEDGGLKRIIVQDNGVGMDAVDASNSLLRHATSKIHTTDDLWNIQTMGFRGEALPSIASVSKFDLLTNDGKDSTEIKVEYGTVKYAGPKATDKGTMVIVEDLFYQTPARLKHMKSPNAEGSAIAEVMERFAFAWPNIAFQLYSNDLLRFETKGTGNLLEVLFAVYGRDVAENAVVREFEDYDFKVKAVLTMPQHTRATRNHVQIFLNQRLIRSYRVQKAVLNGYEEYHAPDRYPIAVVLIEAQPRLIDVNVHPSKWEVRISKENQLSTLIQENIKRILRDEIVSRNMPISSSLSLDYGKEERVSSVPRYEKMVQEEMEFSLPIREEIKDEIWIPEVRKENREETVVVKGEKLPPLRVLGQYHQDYIICEGQDGLYIIDQHAAEERMNFERISKILDENKGASQPSFAGLATAIELNPARQTRVQEYIDGLKEFGIELEMLGEDTLVCREVPEWLSHDDTEKVILDLLDAMDQGKEMKRSDYHRYMIATMACHGSIRFNHTLSMNEMKKVLEDLNACDQPMNCPHGRPTLIKILDRDLRKEFERG